MARVLAVRRGSKHPYVRRKDGHMDCSVCYPDVGGAVSADRVCGPRAAMFAGTFSGQHDRVEFDDFWLNRSRHVGLDVLVEPRLELSSALPDLSDVEPARGRVCDVHGEAGL